MDSKWLRLAALASACLAGACTGNVGQRPDEDPSSASTPILGSRSPVHSVCHRGWCGQRVA